MLKYTRKWTVFQAPVQTLVNTVNCDGVMGKGLALEVRRRFSEVFPKYRKMCQAGKLKVGTLQLVKTPTRWIINFPTKNHWRAKSRIAYIERGLKKFASTYRRKKITSVAFPPLGCGSGGLRWEQVRPVMDRYLRPLPNIQIYVCLAEPKARKLKRRPKRLRRRTRGNPREKQLRLPFVIGPDSPRFAGGRGSRPSRE